MNDRLLYGFQFCLGSLFTATGLFLAGLEASTGGYLGILVGFLLFTMGYSITQTSDTDNLPSFYSAEESLSKLQTEDMVMVVTGLGVTAYGFQLLFKSIHANAPVLGLSSALVMGVGYAMTHLPVNNVTW